MPLTYVYAYMCVCVYPYILFLEIGRIYYDRLLEEDELAIPFKIFKLLGTENKVSITYQPQDVSYTYDYVITLPQRKHSQLSQA